MGRYERTGRMAGLWGIKRLAQSMAIVINARSVAGGIRLGRAAELGVRGALGGHE